PEQETVNVRAGSHVPADEKATVAHSPAAEPVVESDDAVTRTYLPGRAPPTGGRDREAATPPLSFGDYELIQPNSRGGMGVAYKPRQKKRNRVVGLKMILSGNLASDEEVQRFYAEAEAAAQLDHPGIVPVFEVGQYEGQHFFSMGYVEGGSLADRL